MHLERLMEDPEKHAEALEVFYLCMALGFKGRYKIYEQERLRILIENVFATLNRTLGLRFGELSPHGKPRGQVATEVQGKIPAWVIALFALGVAILVYIGMSLYMNNAAGRTAQDIDQVPRPVVTR